MDQGEQEEEAGIDELLPAGQGRQLVEADENSVVLKVPGLQGKQDELVPPGIGLYVPTGQDKQEDDEFPASVSK